MITIKKLRVFRRYDGDGDAWIRSVWPWYKNAMTADEWAIIAQLISDLKLVDNGLAADSYKDKIFEKMNANCEDEKTVEALRKLAREV